MAMASKLQTLLWWPWDISLQRSAATRTWSDWRRTASEERRWAPSAPWPRWVCIKLIYMLYTCPELMNRKQIQLTHVYIYDIIQIAWLIYQKWSRMKSTSCYSRCLIDLCLCDLQVSVITKTKEDDISTHYTLNFTGGIVSQKPSHLGQGEAKITEVCLFMLALLMVGFWCFFISCLFEGGSFISRFLKFK